MIKICRICGEDKFHTIRRNEQPQTMCVDCKSKYNQQYYIKTKERHNPSRAERRNKEVAQNREYVNELKSIPCTDCGVSYPSYVMQFDHVRGEKKRDVARAVLFSRKSLLEEIEKCEVVCANCHAIRTHERLMHH